MPPLRSRHDAGEPPLPPVILALREFYGVLARQGKRMLLYWGGMLSLVIIGLVVCPRKYVSESKLLVRVGRESVTLDPTVTVGPVFGVQESRENEITSLLDLLQSRSIRESMVETLGADLVLDRRRLPDAVTREVQRTGRPPDDLVRLLREAHSTAEVTPLDREKAVIAVSRAMTVSHTKKSNVVTVGCRERTPELAQVMLVLFVDAFRTQHLAANRTAGSLAFFDQQTNLISRELEQAAEELGAAKNELAAVSVERRRDALQNQLSEVELETLRTRATLALVTATIGSLEQTMAGLPRRSVAQETSGFPNDALGLTRRQLYELEIRERDLLTRYTAGHPLVRGVQEQRRAAEEILEQQQGATAAQATHADDPVWQQTHLKLLGETSHAEGLRSKLAALEQQHAELKGTLARINLREARISQLQARVDLLRNKYASYTEKREEARIDQALESERISNLSVAQPPSYVVKPARPQKALVLVLGAMFATAGALCLGIVRDFLDGHFAPWRHFGPEPPAPRYPASAGAPEEGLKQVSQLVEQAIR